LDRLGGKNKKSRCPDPLCGGSQPIADKLGHEVTFFINPVRFLVGDGGNQRVWGFFDFWNDENRHKKKRFLAF
jgi:hypothetical protein